MITILLIVIAALLAAVTVYSIQRSDEAFREMQRQREEEFLAKQRKEDFLA